MAQTLFAGKTFTVADNAGTVEVGATVKVYNAVNPDPAHASNTLATIFANRDGTGSIDQGVSPMTTDSNGQVTFYVDGTPSSPFGYHIEVDNGTIVRYLPDILIGTAQMLDQEDIGGGAGGAVGDYVLTVKTATLPATKVRAGDLFLDTTFPDAALLFPQVPSTPTSYTLSEGSIAITWPDSANERVNGDVQRVQNYRGKMYWTDANGHLNSYVASTNTHVKEQAATASHTFKAVLANGNDDILVAIEEAGAGGLRFATRTGDGGFTGGVIPSPGGTLRSPSLYHDGTDFCLFFENGTNLYVSKSADGLTWPTGVIATASTNDYFFVGVVGSKSVWLDQTNSDLLTTDIGDFDVSVTGTVVYAGSAISPLRVSVDPFGVGMLAWDTTDNQFIQSTDGIVFNVTALPASYTVGEPNVIQWLAPNTWGSTSTTAGSGYYSVDNGATWVDIGFVTSSSNALFAADGNGVLIVADTSRDLNEHTGNFPPGQQHRTHAAESPSADLEWRVIMATS